MEIGMRVVLAMITIMMALGIFILATFFGFTGEKELKKSIEEREQQAFQRINEMLTSKLIPDATVVCTPNGGIYQYDVNIMDLNIFFEDKKNPRRQIAVMPVLKYKEKKALDSGLTSVALTSGSDHTFAVPDGLNYRIISVEPPAIFHNSEYFHNYLLKKQRVVMNNFEIMMTDVRLESDKCTAILDIKCNTGITLSDTTVRLRECAPESPNACNNSIVACNTAVSLELKEFRNKEARCNNWEPVVEIDISGVDVTGIPKTWNYNETLIVGFCEPVTVAEDCNFDSSDAKFYGPMFIDIPEERYIVNHCIKSIYSGGSR